MGTALLNQRNIPIALLMKPAPLLWFNALSRTDNKDTPSPDREALLEENVSLEDTLYYAEAVLERNARQLDSYVDEAHQWDDQEEEEKYYILLKPMMQDKLAEVS